MMMQEERVGPIERGHSWQKGESKKQRTEKRRREINARERNERVGVCQSSVVFGPPGQALIDRRTPTKQMVKARRYEQLDTPARSPSPSLRVHSDSLFLLFLFLVQFTDQQSSTAQREGEAEMG